MNGDLEQALRDQVSEPAASLRQRVLSAVRCELAMPVPPATRMVSRGAWLTLTAAALVVWVHLSWSAALRTHLPRTHNSDEEVALFVKQIQELAPELSAMESRRMAIVMRAGEKLSWGG